MHGHIRWGHGVGWNWSILRVLDIALPGFGCDHRDDLNRLPRCFLPVLGGSTGRIRRTRPLLQTKWFPDHNWFQDHNLIAEVVTSAAGLGFFVGILFGVGGIGGLGPPAFAPINQRW